MIKQSTAKKKRPKKQQDDSSGPHGESVEEEDLEQEFECPFCAVQFDGDKLAFARHLQKCLKLYTRKQDVQELELEL